MLETFASFDAHFLPLKTKNISSIFTEHLKNKSSVSNQLHRIIYSILQVNSAKYKVLFVVEHKMDGLKQQHLIDNNCAKF